jgi:hypothetical protein
MKSMAETVICINSGKCGCGHESVTRGCIYTIGEMFQDIVLLFGRPMPIMCGVEGCVGVVVEVVGKEHLFCSALFEPLNDGDREIIETHEPKINLPKKVPENV